MPRLLKQEASLAKGRGSGERRGRDSAPHFPCQREGDRRTPVEGFCSQLRCGGEVSRGEGWAEEFCH